MHEKRVVYNSSVYGTKDYIQEMYVGTVEVRRSVGAACKRDLNQSVLLSYDEVFDFCKNL